MKNQNGNVLLYVLIAVALMAALAYSVSRDNRGEQADRMDDVRTDLIATQMIEHVASAEQVIYNMTQWGADYSDLKFDLPGTADFNTDVTNQVYHPQGGGLQNMQFTSEDMFDPNSTAVTPRLWRWMNLVNVEWSPTTATDLTLIFIDLNEAICAKINEKLLGTSDIPVTTLSYSATFHESMATPKDFEVDDCAECENVTSMCIKNSSSYGFYTIIGSR